MRLSFPLDDTIFLYTRPGEPIRQPWVSALTVYSDGACTQLADLRTPTGDPITGSIIYVQDDGLLPSFQGPDNGAKVLWAKPAEGRAYRLEARLSSQIAALLSEAQAYADAATGSVDTLLIDEPGAVPGTQTDGTRVIYNDTPYAWHVLAVRYSVRTAGAEQTAVFLKADGTSIAEAASTINAAETTTSSGLIENDDVVIQPGVALGVRSGPVSGSYTSAPTGLICQVTVKYIPADSISSA